MKSSWYKFQPISNETSNLIGNILFANRFLLLLVPFLLMQCTSEKASIQTSILSGLHVGLPWDSAKVLTDSAGWVCDTPLTYSPESTTLLFNYIRIPNVDDTFQPLLNFKGGKLEIFSLRDISIIFSDPDSPHTHSKKKYKQFETVLESLFGHPSTSRTKIHTLAHDETHLDTTFIRTWVNAQTPSVRTFQYDALYDGLSFAAF